jgi:hypothetical protein
MDLVVNLQVFQGSTLLAAPPIALKDALQQLAISLFA